ncbi:peroxiredoxin-like family protein [Cohnella thailandensis]|uniref:thioredoxin-dependent peroxiredoxin n=1 Tax=Cohnella thailandensis TaxID=557557 RepID=A0A841SRN2_9BACL|nr:peroxiredoxin-like family protein [Cohnella thailandensis]MBB6632838.1 AhpC/TSA family protein [Cohnella thailandensis]MBP1975468.1 peroxiredoxin [Cohnella thailandensis]
MSLNQELTQMKQAFEANSPLEAQTALYRHIREQQESADPFGLQVGQKARDFTLTDALGREINLYDELAHGPVVLTFYRGGWCPYCSRQLKAYQQVLPEIEALGAQLIAISPQSPDETLSHTEKDELRFKVLSDRHGLVAASYRILYDVPEYIQDVLQQGFGLDLAEYNATNRWILPVPSTFMIDESGIVRSAYVNPDFMQRFEPEEILNELRKL